MSAIKANGLSKKYRSYAKPLDRVKEKLIPGKKKYYREFTALNDINFDVKKGMTVGVMGPNGAGKSTLLKILAGIIEPTDGTVEINGKVSSIIELGAGFHPEFSGRENIAMNAVLMGLDDEEIGEMNDEVIRFAELGHYIDMPVKTYSSGMFVRLAFSIAINVNPDILLIDEALAVGDAVFAHRCLSKIREMQERGVTIFFVSHDVNSIAQICDYAMMLDRGKLSAQGNPKEVIHKYNVTVAERLSHQPISGDRGVTFHEIGAPQTGGDILEQRFGTFETKITSIKILNQAGQDTTQITSGENVKVRYEIMFNTNVENPIVGMMIKNRIGQEIFGSNTYLKKINTGCYYEGEKAVFEFDLPMNLGIGSYTISAAIHTVGGHFYDYRVDALVFEIVGPVDSIGITAITSEVNFRKEISAGDKSEKEMTEIFYGDAPAELIFDNHSMKYIKGDWHTAFKEEDDWVRWMGLRGVIYLSKTSETKEVVIKLKTHYPLCSTQPVCGKVKVNNKEAGRYELRDSEWMELAVSADSGSLGNILKIEIIADDIWIPQTLNPESADERKLSILVNKAWVR